MRVISWEKRKRRVAGVGNKLRNKLKKKKEIVGVVKRKVVVCVVILYRDTKSVFPVSQCVYTAAIPLKTDICRYLI